MNKKVFIIAEAGVNHNGSFETAKKLIDQAIDAGADAVKFQIFKTHELVSKFAPKANYQTKTTDKQESQLDMLKKLELGFDTLKSLCSYCKKREIVFMSSAFCLESLDFLIKLNSPTIKIPSGEITNLPYLRKAGASGKKIILSTGISDLDDIGNALNGLTSAGADKKNITILHCSSEYPTPIKEVNLKAMLTIKNTFNVNVGYSDHTEGIEISIAAVSLGASVIEKHFTLDNNMPGPDHKASLNPKNFKNMVKAIRNIEFALGDGIKKPCLSETKNIIAVRKSIVAKTLIKKGEMFTEKNITAKRPAGGISPMKWDNVLGKVARRDFMPDEAIKL